jgi:hypothetical protein
MEPEVSSMFPQERSTGHYSECNRQPHTLGPKKFIISHLCLGLPSCVFPYEFPTIISCTLLIFSCVQLVPTTAYSCIQSPQYFRCAKLIKFSICCFMHNRVMSRTFFFPRNERDTHLGGCPAGYSDVRNIAILKSNSA